MVKPNHKHISINKQCEILMIHKSGYYYTQKPINTNDDEIMRVIDELHIQDPTMGTRRIKAMLNNKGYKIGS